MGLIHKHVRGEGLRPHRPVGLACLLRSGARWGHRRASSAVSVCAAMSCFSYGVRVPALLRSINRSRRPTAADRIRKGPIDMGIQQIQVTVTGNLGADPKSFGKSIDAPACSFRLGVTPRYFDSNSGQWRDRETTWVGVRAYRTLASNILGSLHKGDPVIVTGTLHSERWRKEGEQADRFTPVIDAVAVGHDLSQGVGRFRRAGREQPAAGQNGSDGQQGAPGQSAGQMTGQSGASIANAPTNDSVSRIPSSARPVDILGAPSEDVDETGGTEIVYGAAGGDDDDGVVDDGVVDDGVVDNDGDDGGTVTDTGDGTAINERTTDETGTNETGAGAGTSNPVLRTGSGGSWSTAPDQGDEDGSDPF
ncbi:hypothetical protein CSQ85_05420 [Bifidobacterium rousetti]|nr:hypothetical protein CSQ85_05420 [Bifidobacterium rousetti]